MPLILRNIAKHVTLTPEDPKIFLSKIEVEPFKAQNHFVEFWTN